MSFQLLHGELAYSAKGRQNAYTKTIYVETTMVEREQVNYFYKMDLVKSEKHTCGLNRLFQVREVDIKCQ